MLSITTQSNYLAKVVKMENPKKHPNADRLQIWNVGGYEIITDMSTKEGDIRVYFPLECKINSDLLSKMNMFSDKDLNQDKSIAGYVHKSGRVRAVRLRDVLSEGMVLPFDDVVYNLVNCYPVQPELNVGTEFDTIDGVILCQKYEPVVNEVRSGGGTGKPRGPKVSDLLVADQFRFHYDTSKLQDSITKFDDENDVIVITDKWHGTSAIFSNLLTKRRLSIWERVKKFFGANVQTEEYSKLYASRSVIKSIEGKYNVPDGGYYNADIWGKVFNEIKDKLFPGYTIYGEIVGYVGQSMIQKGYDYGCKPGEHKFLVYRITENSVFTDYKPYEYSWEEIQDFCREHGLETVKEFYIGTIKSWVEKNMLAEESFLNALKRVYLERQCSWCNTKVPAEGICIRNEWGNKTAYKLKSKAFLERETKELDTATEVLS